MYIIINFIKKMNSLIVTSQYLSDTDKTSFQVLGTQLYDFLFIVKPQSFNTITCHGEVTIRGIEGKDLWKNMFSVLMENGTIAINA